MDITTICKVIIDIGILQTCSLYHVGAVDGNLFQVPEMVEWAEAERTCQKNNGKLFQPNETSFDVSLFSECNFSDDLWIAATYINIINVGSAFRGDSFIRCAMCNTDASCGVICLYKACGNQCNVVCKDSHNHLVSYTPNSWTEAKQWCSGYASELCDKIQTASLLSQYCFPGCFWTRNVILVQLQTEVGQGNEPEECGILHNGTLSFTSCNRHLQPLCERAVANALPRIGKLLHVAYYGNNVSETVAMTTLETPRYYFSEGNNSCILMNTKITSMTTTQRTNRIHATITTSSKYETLSVANDIEKRTTIGFNEENPSLFVPVGVTPSKNDLEDSPKFSDTGIIIGGVVGSVVFFMLTVLGIICVRRKLLQRTFRSKHDTNMHNTDIIDPNQSHDVPLETGSGFTVIAQLESNSEELHTSIVGTISDLRKPASFLDPEGSKFNYETLTRKVNVNSCNPNSNIDYNGYEHLNSVQERRNDNLTGNIYDTVQYE